MDQGRRQRQGYERRRGRRRRGPPLICRQAPAGREQTRSAGRSWAQTVTESVSQPHHPDESYPFASCPFINTAPLVTIRSPGWSPSRIRTWSPEAVPTLTCRFTNRPCASSTYTNSFPSISRTASLGIARKGVESPIWRFSRANISGFNLCVSLFTQALTLIVLVLGSTTSPIVATAAGKLIPG